MLFCVPRMPGVQFVRQARELGLLERIKFGWVGFNEMHAHRLPIAESAEVATVSPFVASDSSGGVPDLVARMQRLGGSDVPATYYAYTHHIALTAIAAAADSAGEVHASAVLKGLTGLRFDSPTGPRDDRCRIAPRPSGHRRRTGKRERSRGHRAPGDDRTRSRLHRLNRSGQAAPVP